MNHMIAIGMIGKKKNENDIKNDKTLEIESGKWSGIERTIEYCKLVQ